MFLSTVMDNIKTYLGDALFNVFTGLIALVIGFFIVKLLKLILRRILGRLPINMTISKFLLSLLNASIYVIYFLVVLSSFGIPMTGFLTLIGSIGVAVGLALKDSLSNIANGIMLVVMRPFKVGDWISVNGIEGNVIAINMVSSVIQTGDNKVITIPNNSILSSNIINYDAMSTRRIDMSFGVSYDSDIDAVKKALLDLARNNDKILKDPAPICVLAEQAASSLIFKLRFWVKNGDNWTTQWQLNEDVVKKFNELGIEIPYNQLDVRMRGWFNLKKIILFFSSVLVFFGFSLKAGAFELPEDANSINVLSGTKEIVLNYDETYDFHYSPNNLFLTRDGNMVKFLNLTNTNSNIFIYRDNKEVRTITLNFVSPDKLQIIKDGDLYYAGSNGKKIYGDFTWIVDNKEFVGLSTYADPFTKLKYKGEVISYVSLRPDFLDDIWIIALGAPLLLLVIIYLIYLLMPFNVYKRINRSATKLKNNLLTVKAKFSDKETINAYILLKSRVGTLTNYIKMVPEACPIYGDLNKIKSDLLLAVENLSRLGRNFPVSSIDTLIDYFIYKMDALIQLLDNGGFNFKEDKKKNKKQPILPVHDDHELSKEEIDAYHYLEGINVIKK